MFMYKLLLQVIFNFIECFSKESSSLCDIIAHSDVIVRVAY
jgi:hypothetical protein